MQKYWHHYIHGDGDAEGEGEGDGDNDQEDDDDDDDDGDAGDDGGGDDDAGHDDDDDDDLISLFAIHVENGAAWPSGADPPAQREPSPVTAAPGLRFRLWGLGFRVRLPSLGPFRAQSLHF